MQEFDLRCHWFIRCDRPAVGTTPHPILRDVLICASCAKKLDLPVTPFEAVKADG